MRTLQNWPPQPGGGRLGPIDPIDLDSWPATAARRRLGRWFDRHRRPLPWRRAPADPYWVLVSEAMLQQTQVATVVGYFERFITVLPTVRDLAAASEDEVLCLWQGLGYYRRARYLHAAARCVVEHHGGRVPGDVASLRSLPGVGRYTAGAIASLAFGVRTPAVDGNVARVLARWFDLRRSIDDPKVMDSIWEAAETLVPARRPGRFNEALMELGALICTPRQPRCPACPVRVHCRALDADSVTRVPVRRPRRPPMPVEHHVAAVVHRGFLALEQRGDRGLWGRMWQMPTFESMPAGTDAASLRRRVREVGVHAVRDVGRLESFTHQTTHRTIRFHLWLVRLAGRRPSPDGWVWRRLGATDDLPLAVPQRRALAIMAASLARPNGAGTARCTPRRGGAGATRTS